ncbi:MAG TPA: hypothetical protein ENI33_00070 [Thermoplasmatales archaeon]|nr:hypothetical protein [Thermoplasmatales archaeon]
MNFIVINIRFSFFIFMDISFAITSFLLINYMMDPVGNVPAFISIVKNNRKKIAGKYLILCLFIITFFIFLANMLFQLFDVAIIIFQMFAGVLLFILGIKMLFFEKKKAKSLPFIISLYSGPGVITTTIYMLSKAENFNEKVYVYGVVVSAIIFSWISIAMYEKFEIYFKKIIRYAVGWKGILLILFGIYFFIDSLFCFHL